MTASSSKTHRWAWRRARRGRCSQSRMPPGPQPQGLNHSVCKIGSGEGSTFVWEPLGWQLGLVSSSLLQPNSNQNKRWSSFSVATENQLYFLNSLKPFPQLSLSLVSLPGVTMSSLIPPQGRHQEEN